MRVLLMNHPFGQEHARRLAAPRDRGEKHSQDGHTAACGQTISASEQQEAVRRTEKAGHTKTHERR
jgi:hypothetical protein